MAKLRMRTKFLLSLLLITTGLTSTSLLLVRHRVQAQVKQEIFADLRNSVSTFQNFQREREVTLTRSAELLADLPNLRALMTTQHEATIQDASADLWRFARPVVAAANSGCAGADVGCGSARFGRDGPIPARPPQVRRLSDLRKEPRTK